jgi:hypothetical protein
MYSQVLFYTDISEITEIKENNELATSDPTVCHALW